MPYRRKYRVAEKFTEYKGVEVFHVYKDDDPDGCPFENWFDTRRDSKEEDAFDIRELAYELASLSNAADIPETTTENEKIAVLRTAIDSGLLN